MINLAWNQQTSTDTIQKRIAELSKLAEKNNTFYAVITSDVLEYIQQEGINADVKVLHSASKNWVEISKKV